MKKAKEYRYQRRKSKDTSILGTSVSNVFLNANKDDMT